MNAVIDVPSGGTWFEGHFPGRPILPGVAELLLACDALGRQGRPVDLAGIAHARLRQLVSPGDRLELSARDSRPDRIRIDLKRGGILVADAEFVTGPPVRAGAHETIAADGLVPQSFPPPAELLPHGPPMRFLASVLNATDDALLGTAIVPSACALVRENLASPLAAIEAAAQGAAAWEALRRRHDASASGPRIGYLVALREISFFVAAIPAEREFRIAVVLESAHPPLTHYRIRADLDGNPVAQGLIATYLTGGPA